ncbi:hypothetical protein MAC_05981 [Metarhizium acridum CQMa 102]|uniref:Uncharacterized protein n=1 Tax=Metarhizium acridum (strain CQMa 102) TaxID=655827 RepID=E9E7Y3_METAQ|nr:uncharacterized protein MAC_05981 [Metarhizium acridum CQMa 102]EFY87990.1 hypothetical protein MAC_05981 [Metarhizium acridum CQMa 102]
MTAPRASEDIADRNTTGLSGVSVGSYGLGTAPDTLSPVTEEGQTPDNYGPLSVAFLAKLDRTFGFTLAHHGAAYLTQHHLDRKIDRVFRQIVYSIRTTSSYPDDLGDQLEELVCRKCEYTRKNMRASSFRKRQLTLGLCPDKLTHYQRGILQLDTPTKAAVGELNTFANGKVGADQARYLSQDPKDYAIMGTISKLDLIVGQVATPPVGEKLFVRLLPLAFPSGLTETETAAEKPPSLPEHGHPRLPELAVSHTLANHRHLPPGGLVLRPRHRPGL